ncbi:MAG TPA: serine hydrolase domain-containing protein [Phototrophicaceae bacterium]|nr:serine hydrolase domain-containing protein [Phototrophicaceae bacterium]
MPSRILTGKFKWLYSLLPGIFLLALMVVPALTPTLTFAQDDITYTAPDQSFTATIPARWTDSSTDQYGKFTLEDGTALYLLRVDASEVQAGITAALTIIDPDFASTPVQTTDLPAPGRIWTQNIYLQEDGAIAAALGTVEGDSTFFLYIIAPGSDEITAASPDLNSILLSWQTSGGIDLTGVTPEAFNRLMGADLEAYVNQAIEEFGIPGAAVAVVQNGVVVYAGGFGVRELDGEPVDDDTLFMIGSQTKSMTTLILATMVDEELLDWDTPVVDILPSFALADPEVTSQIRIRDLVNNSSGVPRYDFPLALKNQTATEVIESLSSIPLVSKPGEAFNYSNQMFAAAGYIAALRAGAQNDDESLYDGYQKLLQERIFDPLEMTRSTIDFDAAIADDNHALPYTFDYVTNTLQPLPLKSERFVLPIAPAGAVWSSASEMGTYMTIEERKGDTGNGFRIVDEESLLETQKQGVEIPGLGYYGMGWIISDYYGLMLVSHGGNTGGFTCDFAFLPDAQVGVIVLSNLGLSNNFNEAVREYVFEQFFRLDHTADARYQLAKSQLDSVLTSVIGSIKTTNFKPETVADFVGEYDYALQIFINDAGELAFTSDFTDGVLKPIEGQNTYIEAGGGVQIQFTKSSAGIVTATLTNLVDPSQVFTVKKLAKGS